MVQPTHKKTGVFVTANLNKRASNVERAALHTAMERVMGENVAGDTFRHSYAGDGNHWGGGQLQRLTDENHQYTHATEVGPKTGNIHSHGMMVLKYPRTLPDGREQRLHVHIPEFKERVRREYRAALGDAQAQVPYINVRLQGVDAATGYIYIHKDGERVKVPASAANLKIWHEQNPGRWRRV
jgi:hypothetical protein